MFGKGIEVTDLAISVSVDAGVDILMKQARPVFVTCIMEGEKISRVHADEGIEFLSDGGFFSVQYKPCSDITNICDVRAFEKKIRAMVEESEAMQVHTKGEWYAPERP